MTDSLHVPVGTLLHLLAWEITPNPTNRDELVWTVVVDHQPVGGMVRLRGHTCAGLVPDCAGGWCFDARISVAAIRANMSGAR
ncbi:hypothetical protein AB0B39_29695 [Micromonospora sp. NPDC049114]|uniref:hypothetical protein n=1 Tax=Micromonospora sp. NPDC049114 TaxID=3155498 RepID=UPI0033E8F0B1